jgi:hypothetical protein
VSIDITPRARVAAIVIGPQISREGRSRNCAIARCLRRAGQLGNCPPAARLSLFSDESPVRAVDSCSTRSGIRRRSGVYLGCHNLATGARAGV